MLEMLTKSVILLYLSLGSQMFESGASRDKGVDCALAPRSTRHFMIF